MELRPNTSSPNAKLFQYPERKTVNEINFTNTNTNPWGKMDGNSWGQTPLPQRLKLQPSKLQVISHPNNPGKRSSNHLDVDETYEREREENADIDPDTFNKEIFQHFRKVNNELKQTIITEYQRVLDTRTAGYIDLPPYQPGTRQDVLNNVYQSFACVKITDPGTNRERFLLPGSDYDMIITPTKCESLFLFFCKEPILNQLIEQQEISYFRRSRTGEILPKGLMKIYGFKNPSYTYLIDGAPASHINQFIQPIQDIFQRQLGEKYNVNVSLERRTFTITRPNGDIERINSKTGRLRAIIEVKDLQLKEFIYPIEGKFRVKIPTLNDHVTLYTERVTGKTKSCKFCKGEECSRDNCKNRCRFCFQQIDKDHRETACEAKFSKDKNLPNNKRLSQKLQEIISYQGAETYDLEKEQIENPEIRQNIKDKQETTHENTIQSYSKKAQMSYNEAVYAKVQKTRREEEKSNMTTLTKKISKKQRDKLEKLEKDAKDHKLMDETIKKIKAYQESLEGSKDKTLDEEVIKNSKKSEAVGKNVEVTQQENETVNGNEGKMEVENRVENETENEGHIVASEEGDNELSDEGELIIDENDNSEKPPDEPDDQTQSELREVLKGKYDESYSCVQ